MTAEVYRIGVAIAMSSNASEMLGSIASDLLGLGRQAKALKSELGHIRAAAHGAMADIGSTAVPRGMGRLIDAAKDLNRQVALMKSAGMPEFSVAADSATAWKVAGHVYSGAAAGDARSRREPRMIAGTANKAAAALPDLLRGAVVLSRVIGKSQADANQMLSKALELRGGTTERGTGRIGHAQVGTELNLAPKAIIAGVELVDQRQLRHVMRTAAPMAGMVEPQQLYKLMMTAITQIGGLRAGTALSAAEHQIDGGRMVVSNTVEPEKPGLIDAGNVRIARGGRLMTDLRFLIGEDILNGGGLLAWTQKILRPRLEKLPLADLNAYSITGTVLAPAVKQAEQAGLYTPARLPSFVPPLGFFLHQKQPMFRDQRQFGKAAGLAAYPELTGTAPERDSRRDSGTYAARPGGGTYSDPTSKIIAFEAAWKSLLTAFGSPLVDSAMNLLGRLTTGLNTLAAFLARFRNLTVGLEEFTAVLAGLLAVSGSLAVLNSGLRVLDGLLSTFSNGGAATAGLARLTGAGGLIALAVGIETLGNSFGHIPKWLIDGVAGALAGTRVDAAVGGAVAGGVVGATVGHAARGLANREPLIPSNPTGKTYAPPILPDRDAFNPAAPPPRSALAVAEAAREVSPIQRELYETTSSVPDAVNILNIAAVYLDGHAVGQMIFRRAGDHATLPPASGTGYDPSMTPTFTAHLIGNT